MVSLHDVTMSVASKDRIRVVDINTVVRFTQCGDVVTAAYGGGAILNGFLVGVLERSTLTFSYVQIATDRTIDAGRSIASIRRREDGLLELEERFSLVQP